MTKVIIALKQDLKLSSLQDLIKVQNSDISKILINQIFIFAILIA